MYLRNTCCSITNLNSLISHWKHSKEKNFKIKLQTPGRLLPRKKKTRCSVFWTVIVSTKPPPASVTVLTSTSHRAFELVADVADCLPVVLRKTCCFFLCSSQVRNFSCSAWNSLTTSPCQSPDTVNTGIAHQWTSYRQAELWVLPLWEYHLCYHSISWKGLFSSLYCNSQSWPTKRTKTISPIVLHLHEILPCSTALLLYNFQHNTAVSAALL